MNFLASSPVADDANYKAALARRDELVRKLEELQQQIASLNEYIHLSDRLFSSDRIDAVVSKAEQTRPRRQRNILSPDRIASLSREIILEKKRPMTRGELLAEFRDRGYPLLGKDPSKNLGTILWRHGNMFLNIEGQGYWPSDEPLPED